MAQRAVSEAESTRSPCSGGDSARQGPEQICSMGSESEQCIVVVKCMGGP